MTHNERIPDAVVRRLPGYYRNLRELEAEGVMRLSSQALGERMGLTASQIRQDINCFGGFGQQGYGYHVPKLKLMIGQILGVDADHRMVIVGAGNIGMAVAHYASFRQEGFVVDAMFDVSPALVGQKVRDVAIRPVSALADYLAENRVDILVMAVPAEKAPEVLRIAEAARVPGVWNFAPVDLNPPVWMEVANVHLSDSLMALSFRMHERTVHQENSNGWITTDPK